MRTLSFLIASIFLTVSSCAAKKAAAPGNLASKDVHETIWEKVLECEDGKVAVDVDSGERTKLQLVLRDTNIFKVIDRDYSYGQIQENNERIYRGKAAHGGVFNPSQYTGFYSWDSEAQNSPGFEVRRNGDTLDFRKLDFQRTHCSGSLRENNFAACTVSTYVFRGCH